MTQRGGVVYLPQATQNLAEMSQNKMKEVIGFNSKIFTGLILYILRGGK
jgi:hypothetical protein